MTRQILLAWRLLTHQRARLIVAICGVMFANILMFMQFGFQDALFDSATMLQQKLRCDLAVLNPQSTSVYFTQGFSRRLLYRLQAHPDVDAVFPVCIAGGQWKNPWTGKPRNIFILGVDVYDATLDLPGLREDLANLRLPDSCFFDELSRPEFGPVIEHFKAGEIVEAEVNRRRLRVTGQVRLGVSFAADGNLVMSQANFQRLFPDRKGGWIDLGLIRLKEGRDATSVMSELRSLTGDELRLMTLREFKAFEKSYWEDATAIGYIFSQGVFMGFLVGFVIVTQILYMDVTTHLGQYATLKAMGFTDLWLVGVVLWQGLILSLIGYLPGALAAMGLYELTGRATNLPMALKMERAVLVFVLTLVMCSLAGIIAMRKLQRADPADVF
jgi:putative ABC transport system permease protein